MLGSAAGPLSSVAKTYGLEPLSEFKDTLHLRIEKQCRYERKNVKYQSFTTLGFEERSVKNFT